MNALLFLVVASFWGGSFIAIQPLVMIVPPILAGSLRIAISLIFLGIVFRLLGVPLRVNRTYRVQVWLTGLAAFAVPFALLFWGEQSVSPGLAGILNGTVPLWVFVLGMLFSPGVEPLNVRKGLGLLLGVVGVVAIFLPKLLASETDSSLSGTIAVTLMAASYGVSVLRNRALFTEHRELHPYTNLFQQQCAGFVVIFLLSLALEGFPRPSEWVPFRTVILSELYLGVGSTSIAFLLFYRLIQRWGSVRAATVTYAVPVAALALDLILNAAIPSASELIGVACVTAGVVILNLPKR